MFGPSEDEPEEFSPEERYGDPERDLPSVPEPPEAPDPTDGEAPEVPTEVAVQFWAAVVFANLGLFAASLGLMLIGFRGQWRLGGGLLLAGVLGGALTYRQYRRFRARGE